MKKKIKDLTLKDMPKCWAKLDEIDDIMSLCLIMAAAKNDQEIFDKAKTSIPNELLESEVEIDDITKQ